MSAVAKAARVAVGTAYVHYESKEELVYATYLEIKRELGADVVAQMDPNADPRQRYGQLWRAIYNHLRSEPERAKFLTQMEESPFYESAHRRLLEEGDQLVEEVAGSGFFELAVDLPIEVIYLLTMGIAVRLAATATKLSETELETLVDATWRAATKPH